VKDWSTALFFIAEFLLSQKMDKNPVLLFLDMLRQNAMQQLLHVVYILYPHYEKVHVLSTHIDDKKFSDDLFFLNDQKLKQHAKIASDLIYLKFAYDF
jgi:hypothetical protein